MVLKIGEHCDKTAFAKVTGSNMEANLSETVETQRGKKTTL